MKIEVEYNFDWKWGWRPVIMFRLGMGPSMCYRGRDKGWRECNPRRNPKNLSWCGMFFEIQEREVGIASNRVLETARWIHFPV